MHALSQSCETRNRNCCGGRWQSLLPLPAFSAGESEGGSASRVFIKDEKVENIGFEIRPSAKFLPKSFSAKSVRYCNGQICTSPGGQRSLDTNRGRSHGRTGVCDHKTGACTRIEEVSESDRAWDIEQTSVAEKDFQRNLALGLISKDLLRPFERATSYLNDGRCLRWPKISGKTQLTILGETQQSTLKHNNRYKY